MEKEEEEPRAEEMAQSIRCLPGKYENPSSIPSTHGVCGSV